MGEADAEIDRTSLPGHDREVAKAIHNQARTRSHPLDDIQVRHLLAIGYRAGHAAASRRIIAGAPLAMWQTPVSSHHRIRREVAEQVWAVARPVRDPSWLGRRRAQRVCRTSIGHCWHADGPVDWWCCVCSAETDGMPLQECRICLAGVKTEGAESDG